IHRGLRPPRYRIAVIVANLLSAMKRGTVGQQAETAVARLGDFHNAEEAAHRLGTGDFRDFVIGQKNKPDDGREWQRIVPEHDRDEQETRDDPVVSAIINSEVEIAEYN